VYRGISEGSFPVQVTDLFFVTVEASALAAFVFRHFLATLFFD
jgi:hypothetical protein